MPPRRPKAPDQREAVVRKLEEDLWIARRDILALMPERLERRLTDYHYVQAREDLYDFMPWVVKQVMAEAIQQPGEEMGGHRGTLRAYCPLCEERVLGPGYPGFAFPIGLARHLGGTHRQHQCAVMRAVVGLAESQIAMNEGGHPRIVWEHRTPPWKEVAPPPSPPPAVPLGPSAEILQFKKD